MSWGAFLGSLVNAGANFYTNNKNQKQARSNFDYQLANQYKYAQRYALNGPSWAVQGLRAAGLNPILAVSNGVNTGVNIPQSSMSSPELKNTLGSDLASLTEAFVAEDNAESNKTNASANKTSANAQTANAEANMLRAKSDAALKQAEAAKVIQDTKFDKEGGGFKNPVVNDLVRAASKGFDSVEAFQKSLLQPRPSGDVPKSNSYTDNSPKFENSWRDGMNSKDRSNFSVLEKEFGSDVARELYKPAQKAKSTWRENDRSKRALLVR